MSQPARSEKKIKKSHTTGLWLFFVCIGKSVTRRIPPVLFSTLLLCACPAHAEEAPLTADEDPQSEQSDIYYNAMVNSIDLDKNRWKPFSRSMAGGLWFYDSQDIARIGTKATVTVTVFPHPRKTAPYGNIFNLHTRIRKIVFATELDCSKHSYRQPQIRAYGYYGEELTTISNTGKAFSPIKAGTTTDTLQTLVCGSKRTKKR